MRTSLTESGTSFWNAAYNRNIGKLVGLCFRYTRDRSLSEDLAHEAFLKAIEKSASFRGAGHFDAWLRRIALNHVLQYIRDQKRNSHHSLTTSDIMDSRIERPAFSADHPDKDISQEDILKAIDRLPDHHRLVFNLYVIDNLSHGTIAEVLGITAGTSKSHLARARKNLRQQLENKMTKRTGLLLLLIPTSDRLMAHCCRSLLRGYQMPITAPFQITSAGITTVHPWNLMVWTASKSMIAAATAGTVVVAALSLCGISHDRSNPESALLPLAGIEARRIVPKADTVKSATYQTVKNYPAAATIPVRPVILKKPNNTSMKKLDSLGALVLVASSLAFDSVAQQSTSTITASHDNSTLNLVVETNEAKLNDQSKPVSNQSGYFRAKKLRW